MNKNQLQKRNDQNLGYGENVFFCLLQTWLHWIKGTFFFFIQKWYFFIFFYSQRVHVFPKSTCSKK